ncbi:hypothetical protein N654_2705 [Lactiplantibacillus plantarum 4_3]|uniref:Uncharacterized protein n=1 Tax=Lactiplantibacillus plantarum WJL TaxID=1350466 RepID=A0A837P900_LACPN|nr:hypothetical protein N654_2705 [Lactiplantibacillus plantarum 4_3]KPN44115.1 hypothetical protein WJL_1192 [Lactiplantibacillus plantarum WJL]KZU36691.1 hypothetical protein Nizo2753_2993 [Lactiplantibacillus plantarum]KZU83701.1 hypothetical protein Nizo3400_1980 [Lactiplantibacillus plantarum]
MQLQKTCQNSLIVTAFYKWFAQLERTFFLGLNKSPVKG